MKKIKMAVIGAGNRGGVYSSYSLVHPNEMEIVAVVDTSDKVRKEYGDKYNLAENRRFSSVDDFINAKIECDIVAVTTMDKDHVWISKIVLNSGYDILLEKPVTSDRAELLELEALANELGRRVFICHVLRYTPFYRSIKQIILDGKLGKISSIDMAEHVGIKHVIGSYVIGKWGSEKECGSTFLLAKCCHDFDIMCWLNEGAEPVEVSSFADRRLFVEENAPKNATNKCTTCPAEKECGYSAYKTMGKDWLAQGDTPEHLEKLFNEERYGDCVFKTKDLIDRQHCMVRFTDGSMGSFQLIGGCPKANRYIKIVGSKGEIIGSFEDGTFELFTYDFENGKTVSEHFDVNSDITRDIIGQHRGGDYMLCKDLVAYLNGDKSSISITTLKDSVNSHLCVYACDDSAKNGGIKSVR